MEQKKIDLIHFKASKSSLFTGRPQGNEVRKKLNLDALDTANNLEITFVIPEETTSFNPSFYLGLLYESYKKLGVEDFSKKYKFELRATDDETKNVLTKNLDDGMRNAINEMNRKTGLWSFIKKKP